MVTPSPEPHFISAVVPPAGLDEPVYWFLFRGDRLLVRIAESAAAVPFVARPAELELAVAGSHYLGSLDGRHCFCGDLGESAEPPEGMSFQGLRRLFGLLDESFFWLAGRAVQIVDWERNHRYCGRCGTPTIGKPSERAKECPRCGLTSFPRLSPAIIVAVERDGSLLLAHAHRQPPGFYSVLAGFVEPGETLEQAVMREIKEEVGIDVANIRYFGSQPWPFPNSLMIAFTAEYAGGDIRLDDEEIADAGWYTAADLPPVPPSISIARRLIDDFVARYPALS
jgi:NAD+ diphosphatase